MKVAQERPQPEGSPAWRPDPVALAVGRGLVTSLDADRARLASGETDPPVPPLKLLACWGRLSAASAESLAQECEYEVLDTTRYLRQGALGSGGQASVCAARDVWLMRDVALKIAHDKPRAAARLHHEGRVLSRLSHPNVVRVFGRALWRDRPALILERIEGRTLAALCEEGPPPWRQATALLDHVLAGVAYLHTQGVTHNDLKPANIMIEPGGNPRLIDFGFSRESGSHPEGGRLAGTPGYLSPERVRQPAEPITPGADVFALGVILFSLLTGRRPFSGASKAEIVDSVLTQRPPKVRSLNPMIPREVARVVWRALEKFPSRRFADAAAMRQGLAAALARVETRRWRTKGRRRRPSVLCRPR